VAFTTLLSKICLSSQLSNMNDCQVRVFNREIIPTPLLNHLIFAHSKLPGIFIGSFLPGISGV